MSHPNFSDLVNCLQLRSQNQSNQNVFTFLVDGELDAVHLSYGELDLQARAIATKLQTLVLSGSRVLLCYPSGLEFISAFFGCLYAGAIAVPVAPPKRGQMQSRLQAIVNDAQPTVVLTTSALLDNLKQAWQSLPELPSVQWIASDRLSDDLAAQWQHPEIKLDSIAFLQYTSGSTGHPKGVMVSHRNLLHNSAYIQTAFELDQKSVSVSWLPNFHDMGLIDSIIQPIYSGFLGVLMSPVAFLQKPMRWLAAISRYRATHCGGPNQGYELCVRKISEDQINQAQIDLSSWQSAYTGAEPIRRSTLEQFAAKFQPLGFQSKFFYPCYGMAESTLMISGGNVDAEPVYCAIASQALEQQQVVPITETELNAKHFVSVGSTWLDTKIAIANPETQVECQPDQIGEIWVSGGSVALGYWQQPEATKATFQAQLVGSQDGKQENWLRTGDLGFMRDRQLFITGRLKDLVILWGRNHYPQDIEMTVQNSHPALRIDGGAAFAIDRDRQEYLVIVQEVERTALRELDVEAIVTAIRQAVSEQHEISVFAIALLKPASISKTSSGKIQRQACRQQFLANSLDIVGQWVQPNIEDAVPSISISLNADLTEEAIAEWIVTRISQVVNLDSDEIDTDEPISRYGIDSSVLLSLTADLSEKIGHQLMPTLFWEYPTITALTDHLMTL
ncbi:AMP-dependent synthetase [Pseudanabaena sp. SR411]|uniref:AMP-binding protein n=1 Tax=Pseudanabaena sp. SR411 TaxID=1980935 RepID=UPI000B97CC14|nr:AMP-binding protein [Pseudanabaena sp. SR411]OYQ63610.1 AMP-dependent synthetase [Pseudanabaena sp. SR411]